jgi:hypothetical protein
LTALGELRRMTAEWIKRYNEQRPHEMLGNSRLRNAAWHNPGDPQIVRK